MSIVSTTLVHDAPATKHLLVGSSFLVGSALLLPGFDMIATAQVIPMEIPAGPTTITIYVPVFKPEYATGINLILVGVALVILGAIGQLVLTCQAERAPRAAKFGGVMLLLGSCLLEFGSVIFMPQFSMANDPQHRKPVTIAGESATDFGSQIFQAASCVYLVSALTAMAGSMGKISSRRKVGRSLLGPCVELLAFSLFIPTSVLFFANGMLPPQDAIKAAQWRMAAASCLFAACALLFVTTAAEYVVAKRSGPAQEKLMV